jgi:tetratricopeptide (TPR) repeat protein
MTTESGKYPNYLRKLIKEAGLTIKDVAEETGIPLRTLFEYCKGNIPVPRKRREDIAAVLGCSPHCLVSPLPSRDLDLLQCTGEEVNYWMSTGVLTTLDKLRRDLFIQIGKLATVTSLSLFEPSEDILSPDAWERLLTVLDKPARIDESTLIHLETLTDTYWSLYRTAIAKTDLLSSASGHLTTVTRLLKAQQPLAVQFRLCSIISNTAQILGEIYYDMDRIEDARNYYRLAIRAADEVDNRALKATAIGREGFLPVSLGKPYEALPLLREAYALAEKSTTGQTKAWVAMMEAEALARIEGEKEECLTVLKRVEEVFHEENTGMEEGPNKDDRKWTGFTQPTLLGYKGTCLLHLHQPEEARSLLLTALDTLHPGPTRRRSLVLTDLALSYVQSREIEEACEMATLALVCTAQSKSPRSLQRLKHFKKTLQPWRNLACVRRFANAMNILESV